MRLGWCAWVCWVAYGCAAVDSESTEEVIDGTLFQAPVEMKVTGKGMNIMGWLAAMEADPDPLNGLEEGTYTREQVATHRGDFWVVFKGVVYDVAKFIAYHPGGASVFDGFRGADITQQVAQWHPWVDVARMLSRYRVGVVTD